MNNIHESQRRTLQRSRGTIYREPQWSTTPKRHKILDKVITVFGYILSCYIGFLIAIFIV